MVSHVSLWFRASYHYRAHVGHCRKLAFHIQIPMLLRTDRHVLWRLHFQFSILVILFLRRAWAVWARINAVSCNEGPEFCSFWVFVPNNCYWQGFFENVRAYPSEVFERNFTSLVLCFRLLKIHMLLFFEFRSNGSFVIIRFLLDIGLHGVLSDIVENHFRLFENIFCKLGNWRRFFFADGCPLLRLGCCMEPVHETLYWVYIQCLCDRKCCNSEHQHWHT